MAHHRSIEFILSLSVSRFDHAVKQAAGAVRVMERRVRSSLKAVDRGFFGAIRPGQTGKKNLEPRGTIQYLWMPSHRCIIQTGTKDP